MRNIDGRDIEDGFTATHNNASTSCDITVRTISGEYVFEDAITSTASEWAKKDEFAKFCWDAKQIEKWRKQFAQEGSYATDTKKGNCNQNGSDERKDVNNKLDCSLCTFDKMVIRVYAFEDAIDKKKKKDDRKNVNAHAFLLFESRRPFFSRSIRWTRKMPSAVVQKVTRRVGRIMSAGLVEPAL